MLEVAFSMEKGQNWWGLCGLRNTGYSFLRGVCGVELMLGLETWNDFQPPALLQRRGECGAWLLCGVALQGQSYQGR